MNNLSDWELLNAYVVRGDDEAFRQVVERHLGLVRGTAFRQLKNDHHADEVSHAVFLALARKAGTLPSETVLAGWLYRATRFAAAKLARDEQRRVRREREAAMTHAESISHAAGDPPWSQIEPHLDAALDALKDRDRSAIILRFLEARPFAEVGAGLGLSEDAAKMRVGRALEKLRKFFRKRGFVLGASALTSALAPSTAGPIAPALVKSVTSNAVQSAVTMGAVARLAEWTWGRMYLLRLMPLLRLASVVVLTAVIVNLVGRQLGWFGVSQVNQPTPAPQAWAPANNGQ